MKRLLCILAAVLALSSAVFAERGDDGEITGTVVSVNEGTIEIDEGKQDGAGRFEIIWDTLAGRVPTPKVGDKLRVHYYHCGSGRGAGFHHCADKIEKLDGH